MDAITGKDTIVIDYGKLTADVIAIWQAESKDNTLRLLADTSHVSYSWIRQVRNGLTPTSLDTFYRLITAMWPIHKVRNILLEHSPRGAEVLVELEKIGVTFSDIEISDLREAAFVARVVGREKLTRIEIDSLLGKRAAEVLVKFSQFGLIESTADGECILSNKCQEIRSNTALKMLSRLVLEFHDLASGDDGEVRIAGLNSEGIAAIHEMISAFKIGLAKILADPKYRGDSVFGLTLNTAII